MSLAVWITLNGVYDAPVTQIHKNVRRQAITRTNAGLLAIGPPGTNFCEILIEMQKCSWSGTTTAELYSVYNIGIYCIYIHYEYISIYIQYTHFDIQYFDMWLSQEVLTDILVSWTYSSAKLMSLSIYLIVWNLQLHVRTLFLPCCLLL